MIVVEDQPQAAEDDHLGIGLDPDPRQQLVVRLAGDREDRNLLALHQAVEDVDHRDLGLDHVLGHDPQRRIHRRTPDLDAAIVPQPRPAVDGCAHAVENPAEDVGRERDLHRAAQKVDLGLGRQTLAAGEDLQRDLFLLDLDDLSQRAVAVAVLHDRQITQADVRGANREDVPDDGEHAREAKQAGDHETSGEKRTRARVRPPTPGNANLRKAKRGRSPDSRAAARSGHRRDRSEELAGADPPRHSRRPPPRAAAGSAGDANRVGPSFSAGFKAEPNILPPPGSRQRPARTPHPRDPSAPTPDPAIYAAQ